MTDARDLINNEVVELSKSNNAILLNHITGTGKTVSALKIAETCNNPLTLIVHYETTHKENIMKNVGGNNVTPNEDVKPDKPIKNEEIIEG